MSMLSDFVDAVDLFAKGRSNAGSPVPSCLSSESSEDIDLAESKSGRSSVLSEISGLVRFMSHKEKVERGYEVLLEDYDGFSSKVPNADVNRDDASAKSGADRTEADSLLQLLDDVDKMDDEKSQKSSWSEKQFSQKENSKELDTEEADTEELPTDEKPTLTNASTHKSASSVRSHKSNGSQKSNASQVSRKSESSRSSLKEGVPETIEEEDEEADVEEKPRTIEIPQVESIHSQKSVKSSKSASAASMAIQPIVSMLSMGSIKSIASSKSKASIVDDGRDEEANVESPGSTDGEEEQAGSIAPQRSTRSHSSKASRKSISFKDVVETNEGKTEPMGISKSSSNVSKKSAKSTSSKVACEEEPSETKSQMSIQSNTSKASRKSIISLLTRRSKESKGSAKDDSSAKADLNTSPATAEAARSNIIIPPALSMRSNASKSSRQSVASRMSGKKGTDADPKTLDLPTVKSSLSSKSLKSVQSSTLVSVKPNVSKDDGKSVKSHTSKASTLSLKKSGSLTKEDAGDQTSEGVRKELSNDVMIPPQLSMKSVTSKASHKSHGSATSHKTDLSNAKSLQLVHTDVAKESVRADSVSVAQSTTSKSSASTGRRFKFLGEFSIEEESREAAADDDEDSKVIIPPQLSMHSQASKSSRKSASSRLSFRKSTEESNVEGQHTVAADIKKAESNVSKKSSSSVRSISSRIFKTSSKTSKANAEAEEDSEHNETPEEHQKQPEVSVTAE